MGVTVHMIFIQNIVFTFTFFCGIMIMGEGAKENVAGLVKKSAVEKHTKMLQVVRRTMFSEVERSGTEENMVARRRQAAARIARLRYTTGGNPSGFAV